jgi:hypothetical protein
MCVLGALAALLQSPVGAQTAHVGVVEVYGARRVSPDEVRRATAVVAGDIVPASTLAVEERVERLTGVSDAAVTVVCCENGKSVMYVGVQEDGGGPEVRPAPSAVVALPDEVLRAEVEFSAALQEAVEQGRADEDHSAGHALMRDPRARKAQERFIDLAMLYDDSLRTVLRESRFPLQRALAAQVLAYLPDKGRAVAALAPALSDPSAVVRNDVARALWIIAGYAHDKPELRAAIPVEPLIAMLRSIAWTDRNKASLVLMALTASRDSSMLARLDAGARTELEEMARWTTQHGLAPFVILGRIEGRDEGAILAAWRGRNQGQG